MSFFVATKRLLYVNKLLHKHSVERNITSCQDLISKQKEEKLKKRKIRMMHKLQNSNYYMNILEYR